MPCITGSEESRVFVLVSLLLMRLRTSGVGWRAMPTASSADVPLCQQLVGWTLGERLGQLLIL